MEVPVPFFLLQVFVFGVGCCMGSFFNVVVHRLPAKESLVHPGSHCPKCNNAIAFYDNIPILSYLLLMGKCRHCRTHISLRYPLVEAITGVFALLLLGQHGLTLQFLIEFLFVSLLIVISFIDLDTFLIPDVLSLSGLLAGIACSFFTPRLSWTDSLLGVLLGGGFLYLIALGYQYFRHQEGLGGGDIKLLGMIGAYIGWPGVVFTVLVASIVGALVGLVVMQRTRKGMSTMVPFGPFLSLGAICYLFWGETFYQWYLGDFLGG